MENSTCHKGNYISVLCDTEESHTNKDVKKTFYEDIGAGWEIGKITGPGIKLAVIRLKSGEIS
jgi:hypothetical protein